MTMLLKNAEVFTPEGFKPRDLFISDGKVFVLAADSIRNDGRCQDHRLHRESHCSRFLQMYTYI